MRTQAPAQSRAEKRHAKEFGSDTFWQRPAQPVEIAPSYVFLASADGRFLHRRHSGADTIRDAALTRWYHSLSRTTYCEEMKR